MAMTLEQITAVLNTKYDKTGGLISGPVSIRGNLTVTGDVIPNKAFNSVYNDYAEWFERGQITEPGDIIMLDTTCIKEQYVKAFKQNPTDPVFPIGVHSNEYGYITGGHGDSNKENINDFIPVGLKGRVHTKVKGLVKIGDKITVSDIPGVGVVCNTASPYEIVGIAVENKDYESIGLCRLYIK